MSSFFSSLGQRALRTVMGLVGVAVLAGGYMAYKYFTNDTDLAGVGDCITAAASADDMKTVDCTDATANYKVVGRAEGSYTDSTASAVCNAYPSTTDVFLAQGAGKQRGYVLCLEATKK